MSRWVWSLSVAGVAVGLAVAGLVVGHPRRPSAAAAAPVAAPVAERAVETAVTRPAKQQVTIDSFAFDPPVLTVTAGTKVTWLNRDDVPHTATSSDSPPKFNSKAIDTDEKFSRVFTEPGTYPYFCAVHPKMTATIVVK